MFCEHCGKELREDVRYCKYCGEKAQSIKGSAPKPEPSVAVPAEASATIPGGASGGKRDSATISRGASSGSTVAASLQKAIGDTKRNSRRRMPLIVLIALALTLATTIAFAAHYTRTHMQQASKPSEIETEQISDQTINRENRSEADFAIETYQPVIEDFKALAVDYDNLAKGNSSTDEPVANFIAEHPYTRFSLEMPRYILSWLDGYGTPVFAFCDLNADNVPECLLGNKGQTNAVTVWEIWSIQNGTPIKAAFGEEKGLITLRQDGVIEQFVNSGAFSGTITYYRLTDSNKLTDLASFTNVDPRNKDTFGTMKDARKANLQTLATVSWDSSQGGSAGTAEITDETGAISHGDQSYLQAKKESLSTKYPINTTIEWINLSGK